METIEELEVDTDLVSQSDVDRYVEISTIIGNLEKEKGILRGLFVEHFTGGGHLCPSEGPFLLVLSTQQAPVFTWKDICEEIVRRLSTKTDQAMARKVMIEMQSEKKDRPTVLIKPNARWLSDSATPRPPA
jgi:hypothetical protein